MNGQTSAESLSNQELAKRVLEAEQRVDCIETTLAAVTAEIDDISLGNRCTRCEGALLLIKDGMLHCPNCGDGHSL